MAFWEEFDSLSCRSERNATNWNRPHLSQLCEIGLHRFHLDVIMCAC
jgi:hypothetical protein